MPAGVDVHVGADVLGKPKAVSAWARAGFTHPVQGWCWDARPGVSDLAPELVAVAPQSDASASAAVPDHVGGELIDHQDEIELGPVGQAVFANQAGQSGSHAAEIVATKIARVQRTAIEGHSCWLSHALFLRHARSFTTELHGPG